jgi:hypothetical protein
VTGQVNVSVTQIRLWARGNAFTLYRNGDKDLVA